MMERLKTRADFLRAQRGVRRRTPSLTLEACPTPAKFAAARQLRVGYTASRKVGQAVARNRAKRRLRSAAAALLPLLGQEGNDYVLVARRETLTCPFQGLLDDLAGALQATHARLGRSKTGGLP